MLKHPLLYVWLVLIGTLAGAGLLRPPNHAASVVAHGPIAADAKPGEHEQRRSSKENEAQTGLTAPQQSSSSGRKGACREGEKDDACFQRRSAIAAEDQARATEDQVLYTLIGSVLLLFTLAFTGWAAISARRAAIATNEAALAAQASAATADATLREMENTARLELRARLSVVPKGINQLIGEENGMGHVALHNVGKLPARNVALSVEMRISDYRDTAFDVPQDHQSINRVIQAGAEMRQGSKQTLPLNVLCVSGSHVFVWGVAYYDDGYGERRFTRFCHRYNSGSYNRSIRAQAETRETRSIIDPDKARYHTHGNDAN
jgi:hypothetical protein